MGVVNAPRGNRRDRRRIRPEPDTGAKSGQGGHIKVGTAIYYMTPIPYTFIFFSSRVRNCVLALANNGVMLWDTTLIHAYDVSAKYELEELLQAQVMKDIARMTRQQIEIEG